MCVCVHIIESSMTLSLHTNLLVNHSFQTCPVTPSFSFPSHFTDAVSLCCPSSALLPAPASLIFYLCSCSCLLSPKPSSTFLYPLDRSHARPGAVFPLPAAPSVSLLSPCWLLANRIGLCFSFNLSQFSSLPRVSAHDLFARTALHQLSSSVMAFLVTLSKPVAQVQHPFLLCFSSTT